MTRKIIDCREFPNEQGCTLAIAADNADELLLAAVQHAVSVHQHEDCEALREMLRSCMRDVVETQPGLTSSALP